MTKKELFDLIRAQAEHCGCDQDAQAATDVIWPLIHKLEERLRTIAEHPDTPLLLKQRARGDI